jgi:hypothetical protein
MNSNHFYFGRLDEVEVEVILALRFIWSLDQPTVLSKAHLFSWEEAGAAETPFQRIANNTQVDRRGISWKPVTMIAAILTSE